MKEVAHDGKVINIADNDRKMLLDKMSTDSKFLMEQGLIDYSLMVV